MLLVGLALLLSACTNPPAQPKIARIQVSPAALLLTKVGESQILTATVFDDQGNEVKTDVTWTSSKPAAVNVSANGKVTAVSNLGSAQISVQVSNVKESVIAVIAQPVAGAVLVTDSQISGNPEPVDDNAAFGVGFQYRINLQGVTPPNPGSILLTNGEKPVAGKVVAVSNNTVTLEMVPIDQVFAKLNINESYNLAEAPFTTPQAIAQNFDTQKLPDGRIKFTQKAGQVLRSQGGLSAKAEFGAGPFQCKTEGNLIQIQLAKAEMAFSPNLKLDTIWNDTQQKIVINGQPTVSLEVTPVLAAAINAKVTCKLTFREIQIPLPGPLGIFLGAVIPIGAGFELEGKVPVAQVGVKFKAEAGAQIQMGFDCTATCVRVQSLKSIQSGNATPVIPQSFQGFKIESSFYAFLFADLEAGARLASLSKFRVGAIESTAGLKLEAKLASEETQINDTAYASNYKLAFEAVIGAADEFEAFLKMVKVTVAKPELKFTQDIAFSPAATASADKTSFQEAELVKFKVKLDPTKMEFPIIGYNIESVRIYRKSRPSSGTVVPVLVAEANASNKQTEFELPWAATLTGTVKDNFVVFVKTRLLPDLRLELGEPVVGNSISISPTSVTLTGLQTQQFTASVVGPSDTSVAWTSIGGAVTNTGRFTAPSRPGTYQVTATSVADPNLKASSTVTVLEEGNPPGPTDFVTGTYLGDVDQRIGLCPEGLEPTPSFGSEFEVFVGPYVNGGRSVSITKTFNREGIEAGEFRGQQIRGGQFLGSDGLSSFAGTFEVRFTGSPTIISMSVNVNSSSVVDGTLKLIVERKEEFGCFSSPTLRVRRHWEGTLTKVPNR
jgi:Bacterial Ig-like domain (group 2)